MSSKFAELMSKITIPHKNKEVFYLSLLIVFSFFVRIVNFSFVTIVALAIFFGIIAIDFYIYANKTAKDENKNVKTTEFSWGFIKEEKDMMDIFSLANYLYNKELVFYRNYLYYNLQKVILFVFVFGDLVVAYKNLDIKHAGIYIALSIFTKFVFLGYIFMSQTYNKVLVGENNTEDNVLNIFYSQINTILSTFAVIFIFFFILSKFIVEIFFGYTYAPYQSSLAFVLLANMSLVIALCIYISALKINERVTKKISKVFATLFTILFVFSTINYVDTVTYFVIGTSALLSIFLYNFVIKKPAYIENTYNLLF